MSTDDREIEVYRDPIYHPGDMVISKKNVKNDGTMFGKEIGEPLHVTVMPFTWWRDRLGEVGEVLDARDLMHGGVFHVGSR